MNDTIYWVGHGLVGSWLGQWAAAPGTAGAASGHIHLGHRQTLDSLTGKAQDAPIRNRRSVLE